MERLIERCWRSAWTSEPLCFVYASNTIMFKHRGQTRQSQIQNRRSSAKSWGRPGRALRTGRFDIPVGWAAQRWALGFSQPA
jgi:hypothetical protein